MSAEKLALAVTEDHRMSPDRGVTDRQRRALELLMAGATHRQVALEVGVARETVTRWVNRNPFFRAELNHRRKDAYDSSREKVRLLTEKALDVLGWALADGNVKVALALLQRLESEKRPCGATTPENVIDEMASGDEMKLLASRMDSSKQRAFRRMMVDYWMPDGEDRKADEM